MQALVRHGVGGPVDGVQTHDVPAVCEVADAVCEQAATLAVLVVVEVPGEERLVVGLLQDFELEAVEGLAAAFAVE